MITYTTKLYNNETSVNGYLHQTVTLNELPTPITQTYVISPVKDRFSRLLNEMQDERSYLAHYKEFHDKFTAYKNVTITYASLQQRINNGKGKKVIGVALIASTDKECIVTVTFYNGTTLTFGSIEFNDNVTDKECIVTVTKMPELETAVEKDKVEALVSKNNRKLNDEQRKELLDMLQRNVKTSVIISEFDAVGVELNRMDISRAKKEFKGAGLL